MLKNIRNCFWYGILGTLVSIIIGLLYIIVTSLYFGPASVSISFVKLTVYVSITEAIFAAICLLLEILR